MCHDTINTVFRNKIPNHIYFIGIGGISMSSLAAMTFKMGIGVSGYDRTKSKATKRLGEMGIKIYHKYSPDNISGADAAVYTAAIKPDDPELVRAGELGLPCYTRAEYLGWLMQRYRQRIGVAGTHGKSTVTSMLTHIFLEAGLDPTAAVGAELDIIGGAYRVGGMDNFIFEACEYTDSFLSFFPTTAVVLNIEMDHLDYFKDINQLITSFKRYIDIANIAVVNADDENVRQAADGCRGKLVRFSAKGEAADYFVHSLSFEKGMAAFDIMRHGELLGSVKLAVPGSHNVENALAAAAAAYENGVPASAIISGLAAFSGAKRRFERKGGFNGAEIYDDYAHHPTEIKKMLEGAARLGFKRIICVYQPHTYSRTVGLLDSLRTSFDKADIVIFADIYAAREMNTSGITSGKLATEVPRAVYLPSFEEIVEYLKRTACSGDLILTMGAGDVYRIADMLACGD